MLFELRMRAYRFLKLFMQPVVKLVPQPRPVVFVGPDASLRLCRMMGGFGLRRVLIVTMPCWSSSAWSPRCAVRSSNKSTARSIDPSDPTYPVVNRPRSALAHGDDIPAGRRSIHDAAR
jgi:hypothetical protein